MNSLEIKKKVFRINNYISNNMFKENCNTINNNTINTHLYNSIDVKYLSIDNLK